MGSDVYQGALAAHRQILRRIEAELAEAGRHAPVSMDGFLVGCSCGEPFWQVCEGMAASARLARLDLCPFSCAGHRFEFEGDCEACDRSERAYNSF